MSPTWQVVDAGGTEQPDGSFPHQRMHALDPDPSPWLRAPQ
jgi:hypothetical protein